jgi:type II secretory pathway component GspD/PulD (secretin)
MKSNCCEHGSRATNSVQMLVLAALVLMFLMRGAGAQTQALASNPAEAQKGGELYQTLYLTGSAKESDAADIVTDLRNMLPKARLYYVSSQNAISMLGTAEDFQLAQKILADIDKTPKTYRLTYTITEIEGGKQIGTRHVALVVVSGGKTNFKQGSKVPVVTGVFNQGTSNPNSQVQYVDVGLNIDASLEQYPSGLKLRTKVEQSSVAEEKSGFGAQDPTIRQTTLEGIPTLTQGKPVVLGSIDIPETTRRQQIEIVSEPVL